MTPRRITIRGDPAQLSQLVLTIVVNALEASESAGSTVTVETRAQADRAVLTVRDDGSGMDEVTRSRLFEPFFSTKFQGRGLGLAAAKGVLEAHGGTVQVDSAPSAGTTFTVEIPLSAPVTETTSQLHVVLFDPDPLIARLIARLLRRTPFVLDSFDEPAAFEARVRSRPDDIAVLLVDHGAGASVMARLGDLPSMPPVIWLEPETETDGPSPPTANRLAKPFDAGELLKAVYATSSRGGERGDRGVDQAGHHPAG